MTDQNLTDRLNAGVAAVVVPGTSDGLVSKNGVPGNTTGSAIAASYVGQVLSSGTLGGSIAINSGWTALGSLTLTPGVWLVFATASYNGATGVSYVAYVLNTTSGSVSGTTSGVDYIGAANVNTSGFGSGACIPKVVSVAANTTYYLNSSANATASTGAVQGQIFAVRIA